MLFLELLQRRQNRDKMMAESHSVYHCQLLTVKCNDNNFWDNDVIFYPYYLNSRHNIKNTDFFQIIPSTQLPH